VLNILYVTYFDSGLAEKNSLVIHELLSLLTVCKIGSCISLHFANCDQMSCLLYALTTQHRNTTKLHCLACRPFTYLSWYESISAKFIIDRIKQPWLTNWPRWLYA